jgi:hypothetical protein
MAQASTASGHIIASRSAIVPPAISSPIGHSSFRRTVAGHAILSIGSI